AAGKAGAGGGHGAMGPSHAPSKTRLPHVASPRHIGEFADIKADPDGQTLSDAEWEKRQGEFLPSHSDRDYIESLMQPQYEPGQFAGWISPPKVGIDNKPGDFEYVKMA